MGTIKLDGNTLSPTEIVLVSRGEKVEVASDAWPKVKAARDVVEGILRRGETVYGINTGFGALVSENISPEDLASLQVNLIRSHACAIGEPMSIKDTRAMMCVRANSLVKGCSGIQRTVIEQIISYLNNDIIPVVPRIGSLGASGDLAPLSHMALTLIGEGEVWGENGPIPTSDLLKKNGVDEIIINTHYLGELIDSFLRDKKNFGIKIFTKHENEILNTGGGIFNATTSFENEPFLVINPDTIWNEKYLKEFKELENLYFKTEKASLLLVDKKLSYDKSFRGDFNRRC